MAMQQRLLGKTGKSVSEIGFGGWQLGSHEAWQGPTDREAVDLVREAIDLGCNFFDTSPNYGNGASEEILGRSLRGSLRSEVVINTKFGHTVDGRSDFSPAGLIASVEGSLRRLQTDYLDSVLVHNPPFELLHGDAPHWESLSRLKQAGTIRAYGASVDTPAEVRELLATTGCEVVEVFFNLVHQGMREVFPLLREKGVGVIVKVPLDSGWLTGKYDAASRFAGVRDRWSGEEIRRRAAIIADYQAMLQPGERLSSVALAFILSYPEVSTVIPGVRDRGQLQANLAAGGTFLDETTRQRFEAYFDAAMGGSDIPW